MKIVRYIFLSFLSLMIGYCGFGIGNIIKIHLSSAYPKTIGLACAMGYILVWISFSFVLCRISGLALSKVLIPECICLAPAILYYLVEEKYIPLATYFIVTGMLALQVWVIFLFRNHFAAKIVSSEFPKQATSFLAEFYSGLKSQSVFFRIIAIICLASICVFCLGNFRFLPPCSKKLPVPAQDTLLSTHANYTVEAGELFILWRELPSDVVIRGNILLSNNCVTEFFFGQKIPLNWNICLFSSDSKTPSGFGKINNSIFSVFPNIFPELQPEKSMAFEIILHNKTAWLSVDKIKTIHGFASRFVGGGCGFQGISGKFTIKNLEIYSIKRVQYPVASFIYAVLSFVLLVFLLFSIYLLSFIFLRAMTKIQTSSLLRFVHYSLSVPIVLLVLISIPGGFDYLGIWAAFAIFWVSGIFLLFIMINRDNLVHKNRNVFGVGVLFMICLDIFLRWLPAPYPMNEVFGSYTVKYPGHHGGLFWYFNPTTQLFNTIVHHSGFRWRCFENEKPPESCRIFFLGSSTTWGHGLSKPSTWGCDIADNTKEDYPVIVSSMLTEKYPEISFDIINAAVPAYTVFSLYYFTSEFILQLKPDVLVVNLLWNNWNLYNVRTEPESWKNWNYPPEGIIQQLKFKLPGSPLFQLGEYAWLKASNHTLRRLSPQEYGEYLEKIINLAKKNGIKIFLVVEPSKNLQMNQPTLLPYLRVLRTSAQRNNVPLINPTTIMRKYNVEKIFMDYIHLTPLGHQLMAESIFPYLSSGIFPDAPVFIPEE